MPSPSPDSPELLPLLLDTDQRRVCLLRLDEAGYRAASFLDERLLAQGGKGEWLSEESFRRLDRPAAKPCDFIFHIGHVGSTLLSRVLGEAPAVFSVREPAVLRALAREELALSPRGEDRPRFEGECALSLDYFSRTFRPEQRALIKATSFVSEIGGTLMTLRPRANAILMFVAPETYLASIFAGEASRQETRINAAMRLSRLERRLGDGSRWELAAMSEGEQIALGWLCETLSLADLARSFPERVLWLDFEALLNRPAYWLAASLHRLGLPAERATVEPLLASPEFARYSKAPEHQYDAGLRRQLLSAARREHHQEIERGLAWLNAAAARSPAAAAGMRAVAAARRA